MNFIKAQAALWWLFITSPMSITAFSPQLSYSTSTAFAAASSNLHSGTSISSFGRRSVHLRMSSVEQEEDPEEEDDTIPSDVEEEIVAAVKEAVVEDDEGMVVEVPSEEFTPTTNEATITSLLDLLPPPSTLGQISESKRATLNEVILRLESLNPTTPDPAFSPLLNGVWELRYASGYTSDGALQSPTRQIALFLYSGGYSPGLLALNLAQQVLPAGVLNVQGVEIAISREQPRVQATVELQSSLLGKGSSSTTASSVVQVQAMLQSESGVRLRETYESATVAGTLLEIPAPLRYSREICKLFFSSWHVV